MPEHGPAERPADTARRLMGIYRNSGRQAPLGLVSHVERVIRARHITVFSPTDILPAPLQTREYTQEILIGTDNQEPTLEPGVDKAAWYALRTATILTAIQNGVSIEVITNMAAVHRALETEFTFEHAESLIGLLAVHSSMNVRLASGPPNHLRLMRPIQAIAIITATNESPAVTVETELAARLVSNTSARQRYMNLVERTRLEALDNAMSRELIVGAHRGMQQLRQERNTHSTHSTGEPTNSP